MNECTCGTPRGTGTHEQSCDVFKNLTITDLLNGLYFKDLTDDLLKYCESFAKHLDERPAFYAHAMAADLTEGLREVFDPLNPQLTIERSIAVHKEWFETHFTDERLKALEDNRTIAQVYGFTMSIFASFSAEVNHLFGVYFD